ncbi:primary-amine oxidase [Pseudoclavibacter sp. RFBB5]|uniref:primary-amine oxidase n=1 Tax=Pseudoclavibacter sp. RFBB5 TaxID=2080574 RepID=UPI000CE90548|nr:primary-amine oxidase [Pseudoclavibacter sp. RFBB5]PPG27241.1 tyramine oxidase [Pseudoclavibacter sp. RFBB5]
MTNTESLHTAGQRVSHLDEAHHPLDGLTAAEIDRGRSILDEAGLLTGHSRFPSIMPVEPDKDYVRAFVPGSPMRRRIEYVVLEIDTGVSTEHIVDLDAGTVAHSGVVPSGEFPYGQPAYLFEEYDRAMEIAKSSELWQAAMRRRGLGDRIADAFCSPLAPGYFGYEDEIGRRMIRSLTFLRDHPDDVAWAHPVEGLLVTINLTAGEVVSVYDEGEVVTAATSGRYDEEHVGPARSTLKPIEITQPEGPSYRVDGSLVEWEGWQFRVGFNAREGLVLNQLSFLDGDERRPILYRGSVPEMVVPYGDTSRNRYWISYFDAGEYYLGKSANALSLGCDCLGVIHYFDGMSHDDHGNALRIPQAVCMHEEDASILYKHTEFGYGTDVRRQRRLVISYIATIGNYDYGFYWHLYLDGTIEVEAKATGLVFNGSGTPGVTEAHRLEIAPGLFAPVHQHIFCARLDVEIDGADNYVDKSEVKRIPMGEQNPYGNAFTWDRERVQVEGGFDDDRSVRRTWHIGSNRRKNVVGKATEYELLGEGWPTLLADPESSVYQRATFAAHNTWVTRYHDDERWPAGKYPNQHAGGAGLPEYVGDAESVDGGDIVVWHSFGPTHLPRPEDFPIMPVDIYRFQLKPYGFFDRNPALDVPDWSKRGESGSCCAHSAQRRYGRMPAE